MLAKGVRPSVGCRTGVTVNTIAAAPHHCGSTPTTRATTLTRAVSLSAPALGGPGNAADDLAPLVALLADPGGAPFLTAGTSRRRRRHLGGAVTATELDCSRVARSSSPEPAAGSAAGIALGVRDPRRERGDRGASHRDRRS